MEEFCSFGDINVTYYENALELHAYSRILITVWNEKLMAFYKRHPIRNGANEKFSGGILHMGSLGG